MKVSQPSYYYFRRLRERARRSVLKLGYHWVPKIKAEFATPPTRSSFLGSGLAKKMRPPHDPRLSSLRSAGRSKSAIKVKLKRRVQVPLPFEHEPQDHYLNTHARRLAAKLLVNDPDHTLSFISGTVSYNLDGVDIQTCAVTTLYQRRPFLKLEVFFPRTCIDCTRKGIYSGQAERFLQAVSPGFPMEVLSAFRNKMQARASRLFKELWRSPVCPFTVVKSMRRAIGRRVGQFSRLVPGTVSSASPR